MKQKSIVANRHKLLRTTMEKGYSESSALKIADHMRNIPISDKEIEAERIIQLMEEMSEIEVIKKLDENKCKYTYSIEIGDQMILDGGIPEFIKNYNEKLR